jgi:tRNA(fMet)-specific endonuclease VapC
VKFLLDTNTCIYIIKQKPASVIQRFGKLAPGDVCISVITLYELIYGAYKSARVQQNIDAINGFTGPLEVMQFDIRDADICAKLRSVLEKRGKVIGSLDMQIAAQALARNCILVTNNQKEFKYIKELQLENWVARI